jgi:Domain of unknown function (DUF4168)
MITDHSWPRYFTTLSLLLGLAIAPNLLTAQKTLAEGEPVETRYAKALIKIERLRRNAFNEIKQKMAGNVPQINCYESSSLDSLSPDIREIAKDYCDKSEQIVQENKLSIDDFNKITRAITGSSPNKALKQKIQTEMMRIKK